MFENKKKQFKLSRLIVIVIILLCIIGIVMGLYWGLGLNKKLKDQENIKDLILAYGNFYRIMYILLHFIQSTLLPISNFPTILAGNLIFTPWENALLTSIGVVLGSLVGFGIGKLFGRKAVDWVVGEENTKKLLKTFEGKEKVVLVLILLLPFFPDDIICFIAGITLISWRFFALSVLVLRPVPIIFMCVL
ncbi:MAG: VTT domain-containing protein, partial [Bacilli bacterium]|nr:VTT domain-containing protein [Bacilli bacterium]